jgi:hypothetical protein
MNKIGRNDICYCGSGKKYKKCCKNNDDNLEPQSQYMPSELMDLSITHLQENFPNITFINVSDILNRQSYRQLQLKHMTDNVCQVAERINKNEGVFKERTLIEYDLIVMYRGAYRVLYGGNNILQYMMSLKSFFANPNNDPK